MPNVKAIAVLAASLLFAAASSDAAAETFRVRTDARGQAVLKYSTPSDGAMTVFVERADGAKVNVRIYNHRRGMIAASDREAMLVVHFQAKEKGQYVLVLRGEANESYTVYISYALIA